jgi:hypothetical protein
MSAIFDEIRGFEGAGARPEFAELAHWLDQTPRSELLRRQEAAEATFRQLGITFAVYGDDGSYHLILFPEFLPHRNGKSSPPGWFSGSKQSMPFSVTFTGIVEFWRMVLFRLI